MCCDNVSLRVNGLLHTGQWNCGFWPHSNLMCRVSVPFREYFLPHLLQLNPPGGVIRSDTGEKVNSCFESFFGFIIFNSTVHDRPVKNIKLVQQYLHNSINSSQLKLTAHTYSLLLNNLSSSDFQPLELLCLELLIYWYIIQLL